MEYALIFRFILLGVLLLGSAFFAGCDIALFSLGAAKVAQLRRDGTRTGARVAALMEDPDKLLVTIYIGNELINVAISAIVTVLALELFGDLGVALFLGAGAMTLLVFGEIIPKAFAHAHSLRWALLAAYPLSIFMWLVTPLQVVVTFISGLLFRMAALPEAKDHSMLSEEELKTLMEESADEGVINESEKEMVQNLFELGDLTVSEIMTPRTDIMALEVDTPILEAWKTMGDSFFARAPVYEKQIDNIVGTLYKKDFLKYSYPPPEGVSLRTLIRKPFIVPETMIIRELLREFQKRKTHIAVVFDEYGGAQGLVTMDDALETLVGEAHTGRENEHVTQISAGIFKVHGACELEDFQEFFGTGPDHEELETIGGYVFHLFGHPPRWGEAVESHGFRFTVEKVKNHRIIELLVKRLDAEPQEEKQA
ncbi:MAG: hemolysin family protein [Nitrospinota bacterium]|nr:hemolysin family protein [Nitrospinota bacterium]MDH5679683.1 hemolysin family protein [Nitrospinota bacterium]MDH5757361.1 hemolysin family protein [Nitrospinota bacterium]